MMKLSCERDLPMLHFLWRWKVVSTSALACRFFSYTTLRAAYLRLWKLERGGFVKAISSRNGHGFIWMLSKQGFATIRHALPLLVEEGFKSEHIGHDIAVTAAHLGDWLHTEPTGVEIVTEQELRRCHHEALPDWLPDTGLHRPDGYWRVSNGEKTKLMALEVELSQKKIERYENLARFYAEDAPHFHIIWIVEGSQLMKRIESQMAKYVGTRAHKHSFTSFVDFQKLGWQSKILIGKSLGQTLSQQLEISQRSVSDNHLVRRFFDLRKNPVESTTFSNQISHDFFYSVPLSPVSSLLPKGPLTL